MAWRYQSRYKFVASIVAKALFPIQIPLQQPNQNDIDIL